METSATELEILVSEPRETLEVEYKEWLDLTTKPHKAKLAKELIALANHDGGHVVLGFSDPNMTPIQCPDDYEYVTTDYINGIVAAYAEPSFHCDLNKVNDHLIISVPSGVTVPIRSKRGSENNEIIENRYYIRRPGPNSEPPRSGLEWDDLLRRCLNNREAELEIMVRRVIRILHTPSEEVQIDSQHHIDDLLS